MGEELGELKPHFDHFEGVDWYNDDGRGEYDRGRLLEELVEDDLSEVIAEHLARRELVVAEQDGHGPEHRH